MEYTNITYIYGLYDINKPDVIKYIGKSNNPKRRLTLHKWDRKSKLSNRKINWIKSIDGKINFKILKVCPLLDYEKYESFFINIYKSNELTNSDDSGKGNTNRCKETIEGIIKKTGKKVYQFDLNGNYVTEYKSAREASRQLAIDHSQIVRTCNGISKHANGFIFSYDNNFIGQVKIPNAIKKQVIEIDINGKEINKWKSLMQCSRDNKLDYGNLSKVCNKKLITIKGRFFKFL